jgi:hypothetical protein
MKQYKAVSQSRFKSKSTERKEASQMCSLSSHWAHCDFYPYGSDTRDQNISPSGLDESGRGEKSAISAGESWRFYRQLMFPRPTLIFRGPYFAGLLRISIAITYMKRTPRGDV